MSKNYKIIVIILIAAVVAGIGMLVIPKNTTKKNIEYTVIRDGYSEYKSKILSSYKDYMEFVEYINNDNQTYNHDSNKYDEKYFEDKSLAIINIFVGCSMDKLRNLDISIKGNLLICKYDIEYAKGISPDDLYGKVLLIEIDKSVTEFETEVNYL